jgi:hypothetical protein
MDHWVLTITPEQCVRIRDTLNEFLNDRDSWLYLSKSQQRDIGVGAEVLRDVDPHGRVKIRVIDNPNDGDRRVLPVFEVLLVRRYGVSAFSTM